MVKRAMAFRIVPSWGLVAAELAAGRTIIGIDEVGRGAWAGPVVAGAVVLPPQHEIPGLADSKQLTAAARTRLDGLIRAQALNVGLGWVQPSELDAHGLSWAIRESGLRALADCGAVVQIPKTIVATTKTALATQNYIVILDGSHNYLKGLHPSAAHIKGDAYITPVAAASVIAKVARDHYMQAQHEQYPSYNLATNKGYGTATHAAALSTGLTPLHRRSFKPVQLAAQRSSP